MAERQISKMSSLEALRAEMAAENAALEKQIVRLDSYSVGDNIPTKLIYDLAVENILRMQLGWSIFHANFAQVEWNDKRFVVDIYNGGYKRII